MDASSETSICNAITAYQTGEYTSIRKCATAFGVAFTTLQNRLGFLVSPTFAVEIAEEIRYSRY
ncbi:hypothetical protein M433DRAFT_157876 [Acidomyces richmondensis BFW]|nr:hypothetical protein M433DRAFT_157876 [Acidomyces richmondensis BFW]